MEQVTSTASGHRGLSPTAPEATQPSQDPRHFLAHILERGLELELIGPDYFLRAFKPTQIMAMFEHDPGRRADILEAATGLRRTIAARKTVCEAARDLELALQSGEIEASDLVLLIPPEQQVQRLPLEPLWSAISEIGQNSKEGGETPGQANARTRLVAEVLGHAWRAEWISAFEFVEAVGLEQIVTVRPELRLKLLRTALNKGRVGQAFTDTDLLELIPIEDFAQLLPPEGLWRRVIEPALKRAQESLELEPTTVHGEALADHPNVASTPSQPQTSSAPATSDPDDKSRSRRTRNDESDELDVLETAEIILDDHQESPPEAARSHGRTPGRSERTRILGKSWARDEQLFASETDSPEAVARRKFEISALVDDVISSLQAVRPESV